MSDLLSAISVSRSGMDAQAQRLKIISQNLANQSATASSVDGVPYQRKIIFFKTKLDKNANTQSVKVSGYKKSNDPFRSKYEPFHPHANSEGFVLYPNIDQTIEMADMHEAENIYRANLSVIDTIKSMLQDLLKILDK